jgi:hypothetical protein
MTDDDATRDGLPRFIYGEYTGEIKLPPRPEEDDAAGPMDRKTKILVASGALALALIVGLVIAALSTGGPERTPAAANPESSTAAVASSGVPSPADAPQATKSWPQLTSTDIPGGNPPTSAKPGTPKTTTKPPATETTKPDPRPTTHKPPRPTITEHQ